MERRKVSAPSDVELALPSDSEEEEENIRRRVREKKLDKLHPLSQPNQMNPPHQLGVRRGRKSRLSEVSLSEAPTTDYETDMEIQARRKFLRHKTVKGAAIAKTGPPSKTAKRGSSESEITDRLQTGVGRGKKTRLSQVSLSEAPTTDCETDMEIQVRKKFLQNKTVKGAAVAKTGPPSKSAKRGSGESEITDDIQSEADEEEMKKRAREKARLKPKGGGEIEQILVAATKKSKEAAKKTPVVAHAPVTSTPPPASTGEARRISNGAPGVTLKLPVVAQAPVTSTPPPANAGETRRTSNRFPGVMQKTPNVAQAPVTSTPQPANAGETRRTSNEIPGVMQKTPNVVQAPVTSTPLPGSAGETRRISNETPGVTPFATGGERRGRMLCPTAKRPGPERLGEKDGTPGVSNAGISSSTDTSAQDASGWNFKRGADKTLAPAQSQRPEKPVIRTPDSETSHVEDEEEGDDEETRRNSNGIPEVTKKTPVVAQAPVTALPANAGETRKTSNEIPGAMQKTPNVAQAPVTSTPLPGSRGETRKISNVTPGVTPFATGGESRGRILYATAKRPGPESSGEEDATSSVSNAGISSSADASAQDASGKNLKRGADKTSIPAQSQRHETPVIPTPDSETEEEEESGGETRRNSKGIPGVTHKMPVVAQAPVTSTPLPGSRGETRRISNVTPGVTPFASGGERRERMVYPTAKRPGPERSREREGTPSVSDAGISSRIDTSAQDASGRNLKRVAGKTSVPPESQRNETPVIPTPDSETSDEEEEEEVVPPSPVAGPSKKKRMSLVAGKRPGPELPREKEATPDVSDAGISSRIDASGKNFKRGSGKTSVPAQSQRHETPVIPTPDSETSDEQEEESALPSPVASPSKKKRMSLRTANRPGPERSGEKDGTPGVSNAGISSSTEVSAQDSSGRNLKRGTKLSPVQRPQNDTPVIPTPDSETSDEEEEEEPAIPSPVAVPTKKKRMSLMTAKRPGLERSEESDGTSGVRNAGISSSKDASVKNLKRGSGKTSVPPESQRHETPVIPTPDSETSDEEEEEEVVPQSPVAGPSKKKRTSLVTGKRQCPERAGKKDTTSGVSDARVSSRVEASAQDASGRNLKRGAGKTSGPARNQTHETPVIPTPDSETEEEEESGTETRRNSKGIPGVMHKMPVVAQAPVTSTPLLGSRGETRRISNVTPGVTPFASGGERRERMVYPTAKRPGPERSRERDGTTSVSDAGISSRIEASAQNASGRNLKRGAGKTSVPPKSQSHETPVIPTPDSESSDEEEEEEVGPQSPVAGPSKKKRMSLVTGKRRDPERSERKDTSPGVSNAGVSSRVDASAQHASGRNFKRGAGKTSVPRESQRHETPVIPTPDSETSDEEEEQEVVPPSPVAGPSKKKRMSLLVPPPRPTTKSRAKPTSNSRTTAKPQPKRNCKGLSCGPPPCSPACQRWKGDCKCWLNSRLVKDKRLRAECASLGVNLSKEEFRTLKANANELLEALMDELSDTTPLAYGVFSFQNFVQTAKSHGFFGGKNVSPRWVSEELKKSVKKEKYRKLAEGIIWPAENRSDTAGSFDRA